MCIIFLVLYKIDTFARPKLAKVLGYLFFYASIMRPA